MAASTLLMLAVMALRVPFARHFGAHAAYLLWLLPAGRMILPALPKGAIPNHTLHLHLQFMPLAGVHSAASLPNLAATPIGATSTVTDWTLPIVAAWLLGAACFAAWQIGRHARFMHIALRQSQISDRSGSVRVISSSAIGSPLAAGLLRPTIFLPADFDHLYTATEQDLALAHEFAHHRRGDLIANAAALAILSIHWFNPIAHRAYRAFRADQELACDATVLRARPQLRSDYGQALLKAARSDMHATACALGPATEFKRRIAMIAQSSSRRLHPAMGTALTLLCVAGGLGLTASSSVAAGAAAQQRTTSPAHVPAPPATILAPAPLPSIPPVPSASAVPPSPPALPVIAPVQPVPPIPPLPPLSQQQIAAIRQQAQQAADAVRTSVKIDAAAITRQAMAQARAELERECRYAKPAPAGESDTAAIARLSAGCVDIAEINREVQTALTEAQDEVRKASDLSQTERNQALAAIEQTRRQMAISPTH